MCDPLLYYLSQPKSRDHQGSGDQYVEVAVAVKVWWQSVVAVRVVV
jgi:hypothetical protein